MALTKTVDGNALGPEQFAYVGDQSDISTWHLPIDKDHIGSALKMFGHETHVPGEKKSAVARKIAAKGREAGLDTKDFESKYCGGEHADFGGGWIEIFRAGNYGEKGNYTEGDLDRIVANYDPAAHEAPACIGHPEANLPAYGWVQALKRDGNLLKAKFSDVDPAFEAMVVARRFPKRSAAFYLNADGRAEGLRHVGFLGAQPPEVKGLANIKFSDGGRSFAEIDQEDTVAEKSVKDQIKEFFTEMFGQRAEPAVKTFTEDDVKRIAAEAFGTANATAQQEVTALKTQLATLQAKFSERESSIANTETRQRATDAMNKLKAAGKWVPAFDAMGMGLVFDELAKITATVEFGEAGTDGKKPQITPLAALVVFLEGLPKIVPGGTVFTGHSAGGRTSSSDPLTAAAKARQVERKITFGEALAQVASEHPELTAYPGGARAGAA